MAGGEEGVTKISLGELLQAFGDNRQATEDLRDRLPDFEKMVLYFGPGLKALLGEDDAASDAVQDALRHVRQGGDPKDFNEIYPDLAGVEVEIPVVLAQVILGMKRALDSLGQARIGEGGQVEFPLELGSGRMDEHAQVISVIEESGGAPEAAEGGSDWVDMWLEDLQKVGIEYVSLPVVKRLMPERLGVGYPEQEKTNLIREVLREMGVEAVHFGRLSVDENRVLGGTKGSKFLSIGDMGRLVRGLQERERIPFDLTAEVRAVTSLLIRD